MRFWLWASAQGPVLRVSVGAGQVAFVNGGRDSELWARVFDDDPGVERRAATEFVATAKAAAKAANERGTLVLGEGVLARIIRDLVPLQWEAPDVIIDTTGMVDRVGHALETLPRLGHVILAAPPRIAHTELATYQHIHVRALTVAGVAWRSREDGWAGEEDGINHILETLASVPPTAAAEPVQTAGEWYMARSGTTP